MSHHLLQSEMKTNAFKTKILKEALIRVNIWSYKKWIIFEANENYYSSNKNVNTPVIFPGRRWRSSGLKCTEVTYCVLFLEKHNHRDLCLWLQQKGTGAGSAQLGAYRRTGCCPEEDAQSEHRRLSPQNTSVTQKWQMETHYTTRLLLGWESNILIVRAGENPVAWPIQGAFLLWLTTEHALVRSADNCPQDKAWSN